MWRGLVPPYKASGIVCCDPRGMSDAEPNGDHYLLVAALDVVVKVRLAEGGLRVGPFY